MPCPWMILCLILILPEQVFAIDITGSNRNLLFQTRNSLQQAVSTDLNRLRLEMDAEKGAWQTHIVYDHEVLWGGMVADPVLARTLQQPQATWLQVRNTLVQQSHLHWQHRFYRAWLAYNTQNLNIKIGRQRMAWGSGRIWNPTDVFNPVSPTALEPQEKLGVDTLRATWHGSINNTSISAIYAPSNANTATSRKEAIRWQNTVGNMDLAMMVLRIQGKSSLALDITGNVGNATMRLEWLENSQHQQQWVVGIDSSLQSKWTPQGLHLTVEFLHNSATSPFPLPDQLNTRSKQILGGALSYDIYSLWRLNMLLMSDLQQASWFLAPSIKYSFTENSELQCFAQLPHGTGQGEFAPLKPLYALQFDYYF